jgi:PRTRC genetic system protein A
MMFVNHIFARDLDLPPMQPGLYEYVIGANGIFVRAERPGLQALIWVASTAKPVRGLAEVKPYVRLDHRVRAQMLARMFEMAYRANGCEILFYLSGNPWRVNVPEQVQRLASVRPVDPFAGGADTLLEIHSHHNMGAFFSGTDDKDESSGFRLFAVMGRLNSQPTILARVGIYGHFGLIPAEMIFELPAGVNDGLLRWEEVEETE